MERRIGAERSEAIGVHWIRNSRQDPVGATRDGVTLHMRWLMGLAIVIDPGTGLNHRARVWDAIIAEGGRCQFKGVWICLFNRSKACRVIKLQLSVARYPYSWYCF